MQEYVTLTIGKQKNIALIAHDNMKHELIAWVKENADILKRHFLMGTGTTAKLVAEEANLPVRGYNSGPLGRSADRRPYCRGKNRFCYLFLGSVDGTTP